MKKSKNEKSRFWRETLMVRIVVIDEKKPENEKNKFGDRHLLSVVIDESEQQWWKQNKKWRMARKGEGDVEIHVSLTFFLERT